LEETPLEALRAAVSRRRFVGLALGAVASLLAACQRAGLASPEPPLAGDADASSQPVLQITTSINTPSAENAVTAVPTATPTPSLPKLGHPPEASPVPTNPPSSGQSSVTALSSTNTPFSPTVTEPPPPTATPVPPRTRSELMARWPAVGQSRVVIVRHSGVWTGGDPEPGIVLQMLDDGLRTLTDVGDVGAVWQALFEPSARVLLKVNCIAYGGPTQPAVAYAVAQRLQEAGVQSENILIFDRTDQELAAAGYVLNEGGPGVRCHGSRGAGSDAQLTAGQVRFYQELDACEAIVNLPTPKQHGGAGISAALKNHYGSIDRPAALHANWCDPGIGELNAHPILRDKTRLVVGAALNISPADWNRPMRENALLLSFDPVAHDTVARDILVRARDGLGLDSGFLVEGSRHLRTAQELNLGATDASLIDLREVVLA